MKKTTLGVIFGNRDFFPDHLVTSARADIEKLFAAEGLRAVMLSEKDSKLGGVESHADAARCADLFKGHGAEVLGVLVVLPNFGDEKGVADTLKLAGLDVPVLVQGYPDELEKLDPGRRRDAFCGKISVCNNLRQYGIPFTVTEKHSVHPGSESFKEDLRRFVAVCRVVRGMRSVRIGAVGARPGAFNTVRYSEKILERHGMSVTTVDLSEILAFADKLSSDETRVKGKIEEFEAHAKTDAVPAEKLHQLATLDLALADFVADNALDATAIQCWTSVQANQGCNACTSMSMMSEAMKPSACEVDVTGALTMYAMQPRDDDPRPLHVLVWGGIEDLAQALHDAPDIVPKLRVYWIGGPNKKWSADAHQYIVDHHPGLWIIEANATYRGWFVGSEQSGDWGNTAFVAKHVAGRGALGDFFSTHLGGTIKMGDTPSVGWLLRGDPSDPAAPGWGGRFVRAWERPHVAFDRLTTAADRMEQFGVLELALPVLAGAPAAPEAFMEIENQSLEGDFGVAGSVRFRFSPKEAKTYTYRIRSNVSALHGKSGEITAIPPPPSAGRQPSPRLPNWWTDDPAPGLAEGPHTGARTVSRWRVGFLRDFAERMERCRAPRPRAPSTSVGDMVRPRASDTSRKPC